MEIALGCTVRDRVTGYRGVVVCRAEHLSGHRTALVSAPVDRTGGFVNGAWLSERRLEVLPEPLVTLEASV